MSKLRMFSYPPAVGYDPTPNTPRFYAYLSKKRNAYYFFNPITNETVWERPNNALIYDGNTLEPFMSTHDSYHKVSNPMDQLNTVRPRSKSTRRITTGTASTRSTLMLSSITDEVPQSRVARLRSTSGVFQEVLAMFPGK